MLTVMLQCETPEVAIGRIRNANRLGADAYGLQVESLNLEYHNKETYKQIFSEMKDKISYVTNYRFGKNLGCTRFTRSTSPAEKICMPYPVGLYLIA